MHFCRPWCRASRGPLSQGNNSRDVLYGVPEIPFKGSVKGSIKGDKGACKGYILGSSLGFVVQGSCYAPLVRALLALEGSELWTPVLQLAYNSVIVG